MEEFYKQKEGFACEQHNLATLYHCWFVLHSASKQMNTTQTNY